MKITKEINKYENLEIFDLKKLSEISGVEYAKMYFRKTGRTRSPMDLKESTRIVNAIQKQLTPVLSIMGFRIVIERKD